MSLRLKISMGLLLLCQINLLAKDKIPSAKAFLKTYSKSFKKAKTVDERVKAISHLKGLQGKAVFRIASKLIKTKEPKIKIASLELLAVQNKLGKKPLHLIVKELKNKNNHIAVRLKAIESLKKQELVYSGIDALVGVLNSLSLGVPKKTHGIKESANTDGPVSIEYTSGCGVRTLIISEEKLKKILEANLSNERATKNSNNQLENLNLSMYIYKSLYVLSSGGYESTDINNPVGQPVSSWFRKNKKALNIWWKKNKNKYLKIEKRYLKDNK